MGSRALPKSHTSRITLALPCRADAENGGYKHEMTYANYIMNTRTTFLYTMRVSRRALFYLLSVQPYAHSDYEHFEYGALLHCCVSARCISVGSSVGITKDPRSGTVQNSLGRESTRVDLRRLCIIPEKRETTVKITVSKDSRRASN